MKTLKQQLASLTYSKACSLLGENGEELLRRGGLYEIELSSQLSTGQHIFWLNLPEASVTISAGEKDLNYSCSECLFACEHAGAAFAVILEEKESLGLVDVSPFADENSDRGKIITRALTDREERAAKEEMELKGPEEGEGPWGDYRVLSHNSGKTYRVALRGMERGHSYCSCPDYKCNTLGTCKHLIFALKVIKENHSVEKLKETYKRKAAAIHMIYAEDASLKVSLPSENSPPPLQPYAGTVEDVPGLMKAVQESMAFGFDVNIYPDASEYIDSVLYKERMAGLVSQILADPENHPLRTTLLKEPLLNYQLEGVAFAAGRGRAVLADDMGLGKTVQGIGVAELLQNQAGIKKVLIVSPASLKIQWSREIDRFSESSYSIIQGSAEERGRQYSAQQFYTICNYEQILRDYTFINRVKWDLIILDEGQRIKNYESKTSKLIKSLRSTYALVLSGTPLENRLEELFSIINFIDNLVLGPAFQFFEDYQIKDAKGKVTGYKNLDKLREKLKPVLLRRTRSQVLPELPPLSEETRFIPATDEQLAIDVANRRAMQSVISKRRISEMDLLKLRKAMTASRMAANCPALADRQSDDESGKLEELTDLLDQLSNSKILIFSEWNGMLDLISARLDELKVTYNRVDGKMKAAQKQIAVEGFNNDKSVNVLLCSNTAAHGLNLQSADTVINVDIPWNPATHEQRSARAYRMGQTKPVQVINLITAGTIEERIFNNFDRKLELFTAALDPETDICQISMTDGMSDLRSRLQTLLSSSSRKKHTDTVIALRGANPDSIALSGGNLLGSALHFLADLLQTGENDEATEGLTRELRRLLMHSFKRNESGELEITLRFADDEAIDRLASALARLSSLGINRAGN